MRVAALSRRLLTPSEILKYLAQNSLRRSTPPSSGVSCHEEGPFRGALVILTNQNGPQFNARTRLTGSGRFAFEAVFSKGLRRRDNQGASHGS